MAITIHPVTTLAECEAIETVMHAAWGAPSAIIPAHKTITIARNSGCVLIAHDDERPVGFCLGFTAFTGRRVDDPHGMIKHHSHMAGVIPAYQGRGIGAQLKWAQRTFVLAQGIELMTWTYDPLETANGMLNVHKLGAVCSTFKRNVYGILDDPLNRGLPSDRFQVDWWLASAHVEQHTGQRYTHRSVAERRALPDVWVTPVRREGALVLPGNAEGIEFGRIPHLLIAVPADFQGVKRHSLPHAALWRDHTRTLFEAAFAAGYVAIDLLREGDLCYYVLEKGWRR